jgi:hypothetical protein
MTITTRAQQRAIVDFMDAAVGLPSRQTPAHEVQESAWANPQNQGFDCRGVG